jgi:phosphoserine aminotransferase
MARAHNFSAGPAILPMEVLKETADAVLDYNGTGMSIMEMSHRSKEYDQVFKDAQNDMLKIMGLSQDEYYTLFLGGGASLQFHMIPTNFLKTKADYVNTGVWAKKAIKEAKWVKADGVNVVASSEDKNYNYIPKDIKYNSDVDYVHITTNNTIYGTEWKSVPEVGNVPLIADMSSNFLSRTMDYTKFDLIYAGAQKNVGPAGATVVVIKKSFLEKQKENVASMLGYKLHVENESLYNTPPCLPVYVIGRTLKWLEKMGGLEAIEIHNAKKAKLIYDMFDNHPEFYLGTVKDPIDRSMMNVTFNLTSPELEAKFLDEAKKKNMSNLKGHRSVGGIRASIYNACPVESIQALVDLMKEFYANNK